MRVASAAIEIVPELTKVGLGVVQEVPKFLEDKSNYFQSNLLQINRNDTRIRGGDGEGSLVDPVNVELRIGK